MWQPEVEDQRSGGRFSDWKIQSFQRIDLATRSDNVVEKKKIEVQILADCYASITINLATELGFFSRMRSQESLEIPESEHHIVTALSVESWPGVLQTIQKHIEG